MAKTIPIIAMTANAFSEDIQQSFSAGMNAHVSKPVEMKVLGKAIQNIKAGRGGWLLFENCYNKRWLRKCVSSLYHSVFQRGRITCWECCHPPTDEFQHWSLPRKFCFWQKLSGCSCCIMADQVRIVIIFIIRTWVVPRIYSSHKGFF